ncbi:helix-turn-helix transcriptional regulator [Variovorax sp. LT1P1]|uniref:helix-turn-helix transcriptional regulator n=1 Tax=Variovorax sp. LT1P1 TaxID=3443730 RepID=UPI003F47543E
MTKHAQPKAPKRQIVLPRATTTLSAVAIPSFDDLPDSALVRQSQLVRDPKYPTRPTPLPFSAATFWRMVGSGAFPRPMKLSSSITCWRVSDVRAWINSRTAAV